MNIRLCNGADELIISLTEHGTESFRDSLMLHGLEELNVMLKDPNLRAGERRDVLNEIIYRRADPLADIVNDRDTAQGYRDEAVKDLATIITLARRLKKGQIDKDGLAQFLTLIGLKVTDLELPRDYEVVDR